MEDTLSDASISPTSNSPHVMEVQDVATVSFENVRSSPSSQKPKNHMQINLLCGSTLRKWNQLISDECCLVLNQTPLFMFVKPLALLISNIFSCFVMYRSLHQHMAKREKMDSKRSNGVIANAVERRSI
jgi:capsular polysaccharide biosynthesis protein